MKKSIFSFLASVVLLLMVGCASQPNTVLPNTLLNSEGVVVVKVIGVQRISAFNTKWQQITLIEQASGQRIILSDTAAPNKTYALFVGTLPKGSYKVTSFTSTNNIMMPILWLPVPMQDGSYLKSQMGSFTVQPGEINNLGIIIGAQPKDEKEPLLVAVLADGQAQASNLSDVEAETRDRVRFLPVRSWDQIPEPSEAAARALDIVRTRATNISVIAVTDDQKLLMGTALGMVHVLDAKGNWSVMSTGSLDNITYIRALPSGQIFAGTDSGRYFLWMPKDAAWKSHQLVENERILHLEPVGDAGFVLLTQSQEARTGRSSTLAPRKQRLLLKTDLTDTTEAKELAVIDGRPAQEKLPVYFNGKELLVSFNHLGLLRNSDLYRVDPKTLTVRIEKVGHWVLDMYSPTKGLLIRERIDGATSFTDFSTDAGITWSQNQTTAVKLPFAIRMLDKERGYGLNVAERGWSKGALGLNRTTTGGKVWEPVGIPVEATNSPQLRIVGDRVFLFTGQQLVSTTDDGKTWRVDWPLASTGYPKQKSPE